MHCTVHVVLKFKQFILKLPKILTIDKTSTYSMELSSSWEANRFSTSQEIPRILCNPKVQYTPCMYIAKWNLKESWNQSKEDSRHQFFKYIFEFIFYEQHIFVVVFLLFKIVNTPHKPVGDAALPKHVAAYICIKQMCKKRVSNWIELVKMCSKICRCSSMSSNPKLITAY